jgi:hypothetical protein
MIIKVIKVGTEYHVVGQTELGKIFHHKFSTFLDATDFAHELVAKPIDFITLK